AGDNTLTAARSRNVCDAGGLENSASNVHGTFLVSNLQQSDNDMRYLHTMIRVRDLDASLGFYTELLGLVEMRRVENKAGRFTLVFLAAPLDEARAAAEWAPLIELTYNWDPEDYGSARNFGHLAFEVDD